MVSGLDCVFSMVLEVTRDRMVDGNCSTDKQVGKVAISMEPLVSMESCFEI